MNFTELRFVPFLAICLSVYWAIPGNRARLAWILLCSNVFYGAWDWRFLLLIWYTILVDWALAIAMGAPTLKNFRKTLVVVSLFSNLGVLGFFKYFNFFISSFYALTSYLGLPTSLHTLSIILPVGISFFTFQSISYTVDVYRRKIEPRRDLLEYSTFVMIFPQLLAGPIVRAIDLLPQLDRVRVWGDVDLKFCLSLFLFGFFKKRVVADTVATYVDTFFAHYSSYGAADAALAVFFYAVQIYCDFSGYTDMAIAVAGLLGYHFNRNFFFPYFSSDITAFWRRWHISLSTWLREYLYISLGGNRGTRLATYRNLMITMVFGGLWHGASWNFVVWGTLHGGALAFHKWWRTWFKPDAEPRLIMTLISTALTFVFVCFAWIFFRSADFATAIGVLSRFTDFQPPRLFPQLIEWAAVPLVFVHWLGYAGGSASRFAGPIGWRFSIGYGFAWAVCLMMINLDYHPFIYFQF